MVQVFLTDTAIADLEQFFPDPAARFSFLEAIEAKLSFMPGRFRRCPGESGFGAAARFFSDSGYTVVFDLTQTQGVTVRHVWPAVGERAGRLLAE